MKIIVIGAGIAGLGTATFLAKSGHDVVVLEASERVGGRAKTLVRPATGDRCDVGTQYFHSSYRLALGLMRDVGLFDSLAKVRGDTRFFDDRVAEGSFKLGHRLPWIRPAGLSGNLKAAWFVLRHVLARPMSTYALEDRPELDGVRALDVITDPWLREFVVRTLVLVGGLTEPEPTDVCLLQVLRLVRIIILTDYLTLPGGVASLHDALASRLDVRLETPVERLIVERDRVTGVELSGSGRVLGADHVVVGATPPRVVGMIPEDWIAEGRFLRNIRIPPAMLVTFFLDRPLNDDVWSYMVQMGSGRKVAFVTDASKKDPRMVPSGNAVVQAWLCHPVAGGMTDLSDHDLVETCRRELEEILPGFSSWIEEAHVTRHAGGAVWHPVGHHGRAIRFLESADNRQGISFVGDYFSGGYLEPALWSAERAAARIG